MTKCMTVNDVRRLLTAASSFEMKYGNRMATVHEVMFTIITFVLVWGLACL